MSILDVTEDQIFQTLGKGKDPNFKPIEKVRPVIAKPKKTYSIKAAKPEQDVQIQAVQPTPVVKAAESVSTKVSISMQVDDMKKLMEDLSELNERVNGIQKMVKWYIMPQFVVVLVLLFTLLAKN